MDHEKCKDTSTEYANWHKHQIIQIASEGEGGKDSTPDKYNENDTVDIAARKEVLAESQAGPSQASHVPVRSVLSIGTSTYSNVTPFGTSIFPLVPFFTQVSEDICFDSHGISKVRGVAYYDEENPKLCVNMYFKSKEHL